MTLPTTPRPRWPILAAAVSGVFVSFGSLLIFTFGIFLSRWTKEFGWSRFDASLAFTVAALTVAVCSPPMGRLMDRHGARFVILPCMLVYGLAFASLGFLTPHLWQLYAVFLVLGAVGNGTTQFGYSRVIVAWFDTRRGFALATVISGVGAGAIVFPSLAERLIEETGWRTAYFVLGAIVLLFGIPLTARFVWEPEEAATGNHSPDQIPKSVPPGQGSPDDGVVPLDEGPDQGIDTRKAIVSYPFLAILTAIVLISLSTNGVIGHLAPLLTDRGFTSQQAALVMSLLGAATLASRLGTGYLLDVRFAPRVAAAVFAFSAGGMWLVMGAQHFWVACLAAIAIGAGIGAEADVVPYLLSRYFGLRIFSELYGYTWSVYAVAGAMGPLVMGRVFDQLHSYRTVLLIFGGLMSLAALLFCFMPRYARVPATAEAALQE
jgi:MFS family permease